MEHGEECYFGVVSFSFSKITTLSHRGQLLTSLRSKIGRKIPLPVFTSGIYRYFPAWQIRLKWQILANNGKYNFFCREILANMNFSCKMQQISLGS